MEFREHVPLAPYTTLQIGGPARWLVDIENDQDVVEAVIFSREHDLPLFVLGGGSNLLVSDDGFPGLVIHMASSGIEIGEKEPGFRHFSVAAGQNWDAFVSRAVAEECGGIECLAGIPGTVGGTPIQNVGAYGQEVSTTITRVRVFDRNTFEFVDFANADCGFGYRSSLFNQQCRGRYVVTSVEFRLTTDAEPALNYRDLKQHFQGQAVPTTVGEVAAAVREIRRKKGMLLVPGEKDCRSAGSFFKNPVLPIGQIQPLAASLGLTTLEVPQFPAGTDAAGPQLVKVPAAWLLERAGFHRGYTMGRAGLSSRHVLALINRGGATASEILSLQERITETVSSKFGIRLEPEPVRLGV